jgi:hypothetical protein
VKPFACSGFAYDYCNILGCITRFAQVLPSAACNGWSLATALPGWHRRGIGKHEWADRCARVNADEDFSGGFFVAVFERSSVQRKRRQRRAQLPVCALRSFYGSTLLGIGK